MNNEVTGLIAPAAVIVAALIGLIATIIVEIFHLRSINKHLGFNSQDQSLKEMLQRSLGTNEKSLTTQLGVGSNDKSITAQLGITSKSVTEQIGIGSKSITEQLGVGLDDKSLTKQHEELKQSISERNSDIASMASIIRNNEERRNSLNTAQRELHDTLSSFVSDWQDAHTKIGRLEAELEQRDEIISSLKAEINELKTIISDFEEQSEQDSPEE